MRRELRKEERRKLRENKVVKEERDYGWRAGLRKEESREAMGKEGRKK